MLSYPAFDIGPRLDMTERQEIWHQNLKHPHHFHRSTKTQEKCNTGHYKFSCILSLLFLSLLLLLLICLIIGCRSFDPHIKILLVWYFRRIHNSLRIFFQILQCVILFTEKLESIIPKIYLISKNLHIEIIFGSEVKW
jgi:hypothetical protein